MEYELNLMEINELSAFELGIKEEQKAATKFAAHYSLDLENGYWELNAHYNDHVLWINAESGRILSDFLDPIKAFSLAKDYAASNSLNWKPSFTLELQRECWVVGVLKGQLGGQTYIYVSHAGNVLKHWVNPK
jgi:hypothetical protein